MEEYERMKFTHYLEILYLFYSLIFDEVGEAIPLPDASVDAVVGTLVLCSVTDVDMTLRGNTFLSLQCNLLKTLASIR